MQTTKWVSFEFDTLFGIKRVSSLKDIKADTSIASIEVATVDMVVRTNQSALMY